MASKDKGKCSVPSCEQPALWNRLCAQCLSFMYYWRKKPLARMMAHRGKAIRTQERTEMLTPVEVVPMRKRKSRK